VQEVSETLPVPVLDPVTDEPTVKDVCGYEPETLVTVQLVQLKPDGESPVMVTVRPDDRTGADEVGVTL
jgi:hypothetical protein